VSLVEARRDGAVCILTLSRDEKLNALSGELERDLGVALDGDDVRSSACVVLTGAGRAFSAGADITEFRERTPEAVIAYYRDAGNVYERVAALPQPTLSAIHGYCLGGGLELALATDFRIADETAVFGFPEVSLGIIPSSGGTHRLVRLVGPGRAKELFRSAGGSMQRRPGPPASRPRWSAKARRSSVPSSSRASSPSCRRSPHR